MADKKISALTAATTPLAGSEVLPIVQSGTTVKVSVANLTAGRTTSMSLLDVENSAGGGLLGTFKSNWSTTKLSVVADGVTGSAVLDVSSLGNTLPYGFKVRANGTETLDVDTSGNVKATIGNFVVGTAGKGIDFSANANLPGATKELLDWYEEGTYTAAVSCGTSGTVSLYSVYDTLSYTRIGRQVTVVGQIKIETVASPVGHFTVNLPYAIGNFGDTAGSLSAGITMQNVVAANVANFVAIGEEADAFIKVYLGDGTNLQSDSAQELQTNTDIFVNITYFV